MQYHPTVQQIINELESHEMWYETFEHEPVRTSEEAAEIRDGYTLQQGAKAIIIRVREYGGNKYFAMLVLPGDKRFDTDKVAELLNAKDIRFATREEVDEITNGVKPGGVPPFGHLFDIPIIVDPTLFDNEKLVFNAGDKKFSLAMKSEDYKTIATPKIEEII